MFGWSTGPWGSNREKVKTSINSFRGTPYWRPSDTEIAKQFIIDRKAAPSLARSTKISPIVPSSYSPVRRYTFWPAMRASCVKPERLRGRRNRLGLWLAAVGLTGLATVAGRRLPWTRAGAFAWILARTSATRFWISSSTLTSAVFFLSEDLVESGWEALQPSR